MDIMQSAQRAAMQEAAIQQMLFSTTQQLFTVFIGELDDDQRLDDFTVRNKARLAKELAPFLLEQFGIKKVGGNDGHS